MIRIVAGTLKGRRLAVPRGVRPTTEMARKAAFDILGERIVGARVLDAAAGSGAYGIEALSRGAACAVFVEPQRGVRAMLEKNLERLSLAARVVPFTAGSAAVRLSESRFDVIFHDPPYEADSKSDVAALLRLLAEGGTLVHERGDDAGPLPSASAADVRRYGATRLFFYGRAALGLPAETI